MADDAHASEAVRGKVAVEVLDDPGEDAGLEIGPGVVAAKAVDLDQDDLMVPGELRSDPVPHARAELERPGIRTTGLPLPIDRTEMWGSRSSAATATRGRRGMRQGRTSSRCSPRRRRGSMRKRAWQFSCFKGGRSDRFRAAPGGRARTPPRSAARTASAMRKASGSEGSYLPVSIALTLWRETSSRPARSCWLQLRSARSTFRRFSISSRLRQGSAC